MRAFSMIGSRSVVSTPVATVRLAALDRDMRHAAAQSRKSMNDLNVDVRWPAPDRIVLSESERVFHNVRSCQSARRAALASMTPPGMPAVFRG
jgi:hypothetical protein